MPLHARQHTVMSCARMAELIDLVVDSGGPKEAQVQSYSPGIASVPDTMVRWRNLVNTVESSACCGSVALCQITLNMCSVC